MSHPPLKPYLLGPILTQARKRLGMRQPAVGARLGVSGSLVGQWESGAKPVPDERLPLLLEILGLDAELVRAAASRDPRETGENLVERGRDNHGAPAGKLGYGAVAPFVPIREAEQGTGPDGMAEPVPVHQHDKRANPLARHQLGPARVPATFALIHRFLQNRQET